MDAPPAQLLLLHSKLLLSRGCSSVQQVLKIHQDREVSPCFSGEVWSLL